MAQELSQTKNAYGAQFQHKFTRKRNFFLPDLKLLKFNPLVLKSVQIASNWAKIHQNSLVLGQIRPYLPFLEAKYGRYWANNE